MLWNNSRAFIRPLFRSMRFLAFALCLLASIVGNACAESLAGCRDRGSATPPLVQQRCVRVPKIPAPSAILQEKQPIHKYGLPAQPEVCYPSVDPPNNIEPAAHVLHLQRTNLFNHDTMNF
jgi:hypothetical protein